MDGISTDVSAPQSRSISVLTVHSHFFHNLYILYKSLQSDISSGNGERYTLILPLILQKKIRTKKVTACDSFVHSPFFDWLIMEDPDCHM